LIACYAQHISGQVSVLPNAMVLIPCQDTFCCRCNLVPHAGGVSLPTGPLWDAPSAFFALRSEKDREDLARVLTSSPHLGNAVPKALGAVGTPACPAIIETHGLLLEAQVGGGGQGYAAAARGYAGTTRCPGAIVSDTDAIERQDACRF
jgi:hypothetical protein